MARRARTSRQTRVSYVPIDDEFVGPDADYGKYLDTMDEKYLDLKGAPDRYYVRGMSVALRDQAIDVFGASIKRAVPVEGAEPDEEGNVPMQEVVRPEFADLDRTGLRSEHKLWNRDFAQLCYDTALECIIGFDCHPYVKGVVDGEPEFGEVQWPQGDEPPTGWAKTVSSDRDLMQGLLIFLYSLSSLDVEAKKP